jgi:hypothetical protein
VAVEDCRRSFRPLTAAPAIHVQSISWANDDVLPIDVLVARGLTVTFDQTIPGPVNGGNFIVTLEGRNPDLALMRSVGVLDGMVTLNGPTVTWLLPTDEQDLAWIGVLARQLPAGPSPASYARARVRLPGETFFATGAMGPVHLDGRAFGQPGTRGIDGSQRVDLRIPSGDGAVCSDFESWFYVAPLLQAVSLTLPYAGAFTGMVDANRTFLGVVPTGSPAGTTPVKEVGATVTLSYPAALTTELSVSVVPGPYVSAPATVLIHAGQSSVTVPLTFSGTPVGSTEPAAVSTISAAVLPASTSFQTPQPATNSLTLSPATVPPSPIQ